MEQKVKCPNCETVYDKGYRRFYCENDGTKLIDVIPNACENPNCDFFKEKAKLSDTVLYCSLCGKPTVRGREKEEYNSVIGELL